MSRDCATREVLFRGKRVDNGEWVYGLYCQDSIYSKLNHIIQTKDNIGEETYNEWEIDIETLGQYTGLKDKNETKIFDGDILSVSDEIGGVVEFNDGSYMINWWNCDDAEDKYYYLLDDTLSNDYENVATYFERDLEVIGNIHDKEVDE